MKINKVTSILFYCFILITTVGISSKASGSNENYFSSEKTAATNLIVQSDTSIPESTDVTDINNDAKKCIFISDKFCFVQEISENDIKKINLTFPGHLLLTIGSITIIGSTFVVINLYGIELSKRWMDGLKNEYNNKFSIESIQLTDQIHESIDATYFAQRLEQQLKEIQIRISRHKKLMLYFYRQYFVSISMTSGLALIAGISLIFIARKGIDNTNPAVLNIFITTASAGLLYQRLPGIFKQELNRESNRSLFLKYTDLGHTILSYAATGKVRDNTQVTSQSFSTKLEADKFIHFIDRELARLNQIPIEFDATKVIKITDLQESINGTFDSPVNVDSSAPNSNGVDFQSRGNVNNAESTVNVDGSLGTDSDDSDDISE